MEINPPAVPAPLGMRVLAAILDSVIIFLIWFIIIWHWGTETIEGEKITYRNTGDFTDPGNGGILGYS